jgi:phage-related protein|tara:strand:- start:379 stop:705 length:327 start_codon:yes stop_codon:yes gene_type:complete
MQWHVETLNTKVDEELERLEPTFLTKFLRISEMLEAFGPHQVREPYVKSLGNKLWEIRMKGKSGIARAIYVTVRERRIVVLHVFIKKTDKTPRSAIKLALERLKEIRK